MILICPVTGKRLKTRVKSYKNIDTDPDARVEYYVWSEDNKEAQSIIDNL